MLPESALKDIRPFFATPAFGSSCYTSYTYSLFNLAFYLAERRIETRLALHSQSLITSARNRLVAEFLMDDRATHLFFIDADIEFAPSSIFRLLLSGHDVVGGVCPLKQSFKEWPDLIPSMPKQAFREKFTGYVVNSLDGKLDFDEDGFASAKHVGTGVLCIKRSVFERMIEAYPDAKYIPDDNPPQEITDNTYSFFDTMIDPVTKKFYPEDYAFCEKWRALGGQVMVDLHSKFNHYGQFNWHGDFFASMKANASEEELAQLRNGNADPDK